MKPLDEYKTNGELVEGILALPNNTKSKTALGKLNRDKLEMEYLDLHDKLEQGEQTEVEEAVEAKEPAKPAETKFKADEKFKTAQPKDASEVFMANKPIDKTTVVELDIYKKYIYFMPFGSKKVVIENLGFGEVYYKVDGNAVHGDKEALIVRGQQVELEVNKYVELISASTPRVKFKEE